MNTTNNNINTNIFNIAKNKNNSNSLLYKFNFTDSHFVDIVKLFKPILNKELVNIILAPNFDLGNMKTLEINILHHLLIKELISLFALSKSLKNEYKTTSFVYPLMELFEQRIYTNFQTRIDSMFVYSDKFKSITPPDNSEIKSKNIKSLADLIYNLLFLFMEVEVYYFYCNYMLSSELKTALEYTKNKRLNKLFNKSRIQELRESPNETLTKRDILVRIEDLKKMSTRDTRVLLGKEKKYINNDKNDYYFICKFSNPQFIIDKNIQNNIHALEYYKDNNSNHIDFYTKENFNKSKTLFKSLNLREYIPVVSSILFISENTFDNIINSLLGPEDLNDINKLDHLKRLEDIKIYHTYIIYGHTNTERPHFFETRNNNSSSTFTIISLDEFCLFFATMVKEEYYIRQQVKKNKINGENFIFNEDLSINSMSLFAIFKKRFDISKSMFVFDNCTWTSVVENFRYYGIEINGGNPSRRHLTSPMDYVLSVYLNIFSRNGYQESVISQNLTEPSLFENKINKNIKSTYNDSLLINIFNLSLDSYVADILNQDEFISLFKPVDVEIVKDKEFIYNVKYFILENWIFKDKRILANADFKTFDIKAEHYMLSAYMFITLLNRINKEINEIFSKNLNTSIGTSLKLANVNYLSNRLKKPSDRREYSTKANNRLSLNDIFYQKIKTIIESAESDPLLAQSKIENTWIDLLKEDLNNEPDLLRSKLNKIYIASKEILTDKKMVRKFNKLCGELSDYIIEDKHLFITLMILISSYKNNSHTKMAHDVGFNIIKSVYIKLKSKISLSFKDFTLIFLIKGADLKIKDFLDLKLIGQVCSIKEPKSRDLDEEKIEYLNKINDFYVKIGIILIGVYTGDYINLFEFGVMSNNKSTFVDVNKPLKLKITDDYKNDLKQQFNNLIIQPKNIPMVCQPKPWGINKYGGYLENDKLQEEVITGSVKYNSHELSGIGLIKLFNTINYFNKIKFGINISLLSFLQEKGSYLLDNLDEDTVNNYNISMNIAQLFKNIPFYLNTHADWRGRIYTHCFYISYQGNEMARALLQFWNGVPLTEKGLKNLYIYGASLYSNDLNKQSIDFRIKWVNDNKDKIIKMEPEFIKGADSSIMFSAFCLEINKLEQNPNSKIHFPVFVDATCSGIQHLSAMVGDEELGTLVNLTKSEESDEPKDFYLDLVDPINKAINEYGKSNPEFKALSELKFSRSQLKRPIMTQNYNVSIFGMKQQLFEILKVENDISGDLELFNDSKHNKYKTMKIIGHSKDNKEILLTSRDLIRISMIIKEVIFKKFSILQNIYEYFINIANLMKALQLKIQWLTPTGATITQKYLKTEKKKIKLLINNKPKVNVIKNISNSIDFSKQKDGLIPNVIHSLDSAHIVNLIQELPADFEAPIITVHDCFGTHPNNSDILQYRLKEEFIKLYLNNNFLNLFKKRILQQIKDNNYEILTEKKIQYVIINYSNYNLTEKLIIPQPPIVNKLDLKKIVGSKYMFN